MGVGYSIGLRWRVLWLMRLRISGEYSSTRCDVGETTQKISSRAGLRYVFLPTI